MQLIILSSFLFTLCRPSAVPRGTAAAPIRSDGRVNQSQPAQRGAVMREMGVSEDSLEVSD
jgi:hypothetical protein